MSTEAMTFETAAIDEKMSRRIIEIKLFDWNSSTFIEWSLYPDLFHAVSAAYQGNQIQALDNGCSQTGSTLLESSNQV